MQHVNPLPQPMSTILALSFSKFGFDLIQVRTRLTVCTPNHTSPSSPWSWKFSSSLSYASSQLYLFILVVNVFRIRMQQEKKKFFYYSIVPSLLESSSVSSTIFLLDFFLINFMNIVCFFFLFISTTIFKIELSLHSFKWKKNLNRTWTKDKLKLKCDFFFNFLARI